jgi:hypothetical protein
LIRQHRNRTAELVFACFEHASDLAAAHDERAGASVEATFAAVRLDALDQKFANLVFAAAERLNAASPSAMKPS